MNKLDKAFIIFGVVLVILIVLAQHPGGFEESLRPDNIWDGWFKLLWKFVLLPWLVLRVLLLLLSGGRHESVIFVERVHPPDNARSWCGQCGRVVRPNVPEPSYPLKRILSGSR